jgi:hypothetical protein
VKIAVVEVEDRVGVVAAVGVAVAIDRSFALQTNPSRTSYDPESKSDRLAVADSIRVWQRTPCAEDYGRT